MAVLRRPSALRTLFAAFAILLSPGVLGPWLAAVHVCPTLVADQSMAGMDMGGHHAPSNDHQHKGESCHCVGSCSVVALPVPATPAIGTAPTVVLSASGFRPLASFHSLQHPYRLPPALAPPLTI